ncbi:MAG TPA: DegT/DnrJ/EryC1/StrS family aminotransferase [Elusimicrobiales bacterium]|mgnify:CR=1 FL=1|nr:DegT/DnrJ/EryC1/StrS family aminotransferase [Elusimicrobiales bacterium]HOL63233.1 DegT/DnrJ/EryC1/StrS family aminotransferase [Elusimicrobiales bacterium]HPO95872.1 DegT/DnrJ/EryC1/StrS family aminotransferase [Elusimicrobiales bacterium]
MKVVMVDLTREYNELKNDIDKAVSSVINKCNFILGEDVVKFEEEFAKLNGSKYAVSVASGTDALRIALMASGIGAGDEVITTPFTFIATTETISQAGAKVVFADIEEETYNIDPKSIEKKITPKTKAILPVHLYGHPANMKEIMEIAKKHNLIVIEDCAQAFTAKYKMGTDWKFVGSMGKCGTFSFFPAKNLGAYGDGGLITTDDEKVANMIKTLRNHGSSQRYIYETEGFNSRLDTIQAAILRVKLQKILKFTEMRNEVAKKYEKALTGLCKTPVVKEECYHSFNYYTIRFDSKETRDRVSKHLTENQVANQIYYPIALHLQKAYKHLGYKEGDLPVTERIQNEVLSLPMFPQLSDEEILYVAEKIKEAVKVKTI